MSLYRSSTRQLKASGNVLTNLVGSLEGQLFSNSVWNFVLDPDLATQDEAADSSNESSSRELAELPYHR